MVKLTLHLVLCVAVLSLAACRPSPTATAPAGRGTPQSQPSPTPDGALFGIPWDDRTPFRTGLIADEQAVLSQLSGAAAYNIDLQIADDLLRLDGQQVVRYTNQETEPLGEVYFRLFPNLLGGVTHIQSVKADGREVTPTYEFAESAMRVPLDAALPPGEATLIEITFSVAVPTEGGGTYGMFGLSDGILALAHSYPVIVVYDDEGWNLEIPPHHGDLLYADNSFYLVRVTAPAALTIVASGVEIERKAGGQQQQVTYAGGPMRDFYLAASTRYTVVSEHVAETTVNSYAPSEFVDGAKAALDYAVNALRTYNGRFGVYPYTEFDLVSTPTLAFGIEYPGVVAIALRMYDSAENEYPPAYLESTVAHEVCHQWFYSTVGNDQLDEPWLDESLVQYATLLYWQDLYGSSGAAGFRESLRERWARVDNAHIPIGMPARAYSDKEYGAIVYGRGPLFVETLANTMGQSEFDAFLRGYYDTFKWGIGTTEGLKNLAESHCDCDLTQLFADWVYEHE